MTRQRRRFHRDVRQAAFDQQQRKRIDHNIGKFYAAYSKAKDRFVDLEALRQHASDVKAHVVQHLDYYLDCFIKKATQNGSEVFLAENADDARAIITQIVGYHQIKIVVKSKSMISEEIEINALLHDLGSAVFETDLGEFIVQNAGEKPFHILTPAMHKSKEDVASLFHDKFALPKGLQPPEIAAFVRNFLREKYQNAGLNISGVNFLIADTGSVTMTENEGNGVMGNSFPKIQLAVTGLEKLLPSWNDLSTFWPLLAGHGTGQRISAYNSIFSGPTKQTEIEGPEKNYIILIDNGRTNILHTKDHWQALKCIRCGACLNVCPVYKSIGGYAYGTVYSGPIGSVITPYYQSFKEYGHLSFACSQCKRCSETCPVKVPLSELILKNRFVFKRLKQTGFGETISMKLFERILLKRKFMDVVNGEFKGAVFQLVEMPLMGDKKSSFKFSDRSFSQQWKERYR